MSRDPASHQVPNRSIAEVDDSSKGAAEQEEMGEKRRPGWNCRETLINIAGDNKTPQGAGERVE